jgi:hypothetical protein|tara:strand:+ start:147 stop:749 length:603 start_codon:yes stop_codon:yes gene_type:complete
MSTYINEVRAVPTRLTNKGKESISNAVKLAIKSEGIQTKAVDQLIADGMFWTDFISPNGKSGESTATTELYDALKDAVVSGFSATKRNLLGASTKALSDQGKIDKREVQQSIGAYMSAFKRDLKNRQIPKPKTERAPQQPSMPKTGDKVVDEANALAMKAIKKETDLQNWCLNNLPEDTALEISKLRAKIVALLQPDPIH